MSTRRTWKQRPDGDFSDEVRSHIDLEADRLIAEGVDPEAARLRARRAFGSVAAAEERFYESTRWMWLDRTRQDLRDAARSIRRYPIASAVAVLSLAAGIGAAAATLTIRNVIFYNPPPEYRNAGELSRVQVARGTQPFLPIGSFPSGALVALWRDAQGTLVAAATPARGLRDVRTADRMEAVPVRAVTPEFFTVLGVAPVLGTTFAAFADAGGERPSSTPAMLSYRLWQQWFDGRADALGATIWIENAPFTIAGVLPRRFWFSDMDSPVWTLLDRQALAAEPAVEVVMRRPAGMTAEALHRQLQSGLAEYGSRLPADLRQLRMRLTPVQGTPMGGQMSIVLPWVLGIAVALTMLIACANVAILMIAQWTAREQEIAIRASLGASRGRLIRAILAESTVIAACGGTLGVLATFALRTLLLNQSGAGIGFFDVTIHPRVVVQSALVAIAAGILTGLAPALLETRRLHGNPLRAAVLLDRIKQRWRHALVVLEISVTVALLVVAAAFINGYRRALAADMGFASKPMMNARVENKDGVAIGPILDALSGVPGVAAAALSNSAPYSGSGPRHPVSADSSGANAVLTEQGTITPTFFSTLDVPMKGGRPFASTDAGTRTAIVNQTLARRLFASGDAVGQRVWIANVAHDVVGVAADFSNRPFFREFEPRVFVAMPADTKGLTRLTVVVRAKEDPATLVQTVRRRVRDAATGNVVTGTFTYDQIRTVSGQEILVGTAPLVPLILIGMLLMTAGIYGVLAFAIARRARELAVRVAIGASNRDLVRLVAAHSTQLLALGIALGVGLTFALGRVVRASGGAGSPFDADWSAFVVPIGIVALVGTLASWVPARRVLKIDPASVLRSD